MRKPVFSLPFGKYWSNLHTVSEKKFSLGLKMSVGRGSFLAEKYRKFGRTGELLFCHRRQCETRYQLPVLICHARCQNSREYTPRRPNPRTQYTENSGERGNPFFTISANAFRTTNFRSQFTMRGAEIHGNTCRDGTTRIHSILSMRVVLSRRVFP